ncbi:MAG: MMPL family transporter [Treponema sp.]|jgi:predicted RND superfamily exporter protein|nr:MMPL family transporter [Treponema sp.]
MRKIYTYPWLVVAVIALITVFFGFQLPRAQLDNNNLRFVPKNDPAFETSRWIDEMFGSSFFILIGLQRPYGTVFDREFLACIQAYSEEVGNMPYVKEVTSLVNADYICSREDAIVVEKLVGSDFSGTNEEIAELKRRLLSWDMYERALFSDDFTATQILIPLSIKSEEAGSSEVAETFIRIRDIARETFAGYASVYVTGMPVIAATINEAMNADLKLLVPLVVLVVLMVLFFSFRGLTPVMLPLLTVVTAVIWSVGAMPIFGVKLSVISTVLPVILVAVGSAYGIHIVTHYLHGRGSKPMNREEHFELVLEVVMKIRKPVFLAALTTFAGFSSLIFTSVAPIREFGYFSSFGVAAAFIVAIALIPSLLIIRGPRVTVRQKRRIEKQKSKEGQDTGFSAFLANNLANIANHKKTILFLTLLAAIISLYGISKLVIDNVFIEYFRSDTDIFKSDVFIRRQFGGSKVISVVVQGESSEIVLRPDTLAAMDGLSVYLQRKVPNVGKVMGFTDLIKRINQVFNADESPDGIKPSSTQDNDDGGFGFGDFGFSFSNQDVTGQGRIPEDNTQITANAETAYTKSEFIAMLDRAGSTFRGMNANDLVLELKRQTNYEGASYYEIPSDPKRYGKESLAELTRLIANYLVLLSGNISGYANDSLEPTAIKATVQLRTLGMADSEEIFREIENYTAMNFPKDVTVTMGGQTMVEKSLNNLVVQSQLVSMLFSLLCVFIIIAVSNKSLAAGCIGITPLSISILINFAVMGFSGIKLNLGTAMVAAVSVGVGIDYTIHCLEAYKREYRATGGAGDFLRRVFFSSGKAIIINAASVGAGFAVLLASSFIMLGDLGLLIALTMFINALVSLTVLPALLAVIKPKFINK